MKAFISRDLILEAMELLADQSIGQGLTFDIDGTNNRGFLKLEKGYTSDKQVCLKTATVRNGDDHLVQHFLHYAANMDEMRSWLLDESNADGIIKSLIALSARVDKGFD